MVRDLKPRTNYSVRVLAYNELGNPSEVRSVVQCGAVLLCNLILFYL